MSAVAFHHHSPAATRTRPATHQPEPEPTPDHGFLIKFVVAVLLNVGIVAIIAPSDGPSCPPPSPFRS